MTKLEKAKSAFINCNIDKALIKTNEIGISQERETTDGKSFSIKYNGNISLIIESPYSTDFTRNLLAALKKDSLSLNYNISFKLSESQKALLRQKAISMAIDDAKEKAKSIAESSNVKLIRINSISYLDDVVAWGRDWDIKKEDFLPSQNVFVTVGEGRSNKPALDFNPREIGIVKTVEIEWIISDDK
jgi:uncharacterized protein YggE